MTVEERMELGAIRRPGGVAFTVWAPERQSVRIVLRSAAGERVVEPVRDQDGYWRHFESGAHGQELRYGYFVDGEGPFPDPCSRSQPEGVHALSALAPPRFEQQPSGWTPPRFEELVIYELHIGTFTEAGTFAAATEELPRLSSLGINAIEVMPIAAFAGRWNWGYDGVALWAPFEGYGGPGGFGDFVAAAHDFGIAVILDVVYNHFGPDGNYTGQYSGGYLIAERQTPWGPALNFDGEQSSHVRRFFIENALHWLHEYGVDGLRLDATHAIIDTSPVHFLAELSDTLRASRPAGPVYLIAETHENDPRYLLPTADGGFGFDAVWADDFHHACRTSVLGDHEAYFCGFEGLRSLERVVERGWLFEGQVDPGSGEPRGKPATFDRWGALVFCLQNHDQVGNRAFGERVSRVASAGAVRALTALLLLHPATPLLFQGQEFGSGRPFLYFTDHQGDLADAVRTGRRQEFAQFAAFGDSRVRERIPDPQAEASFRLSRLEPPQQRDAWSLLLEDYHRELIALRAGDPVLRAFRSQKLPIRSQLEGQLLRVELFAAEGSRTLLLNLGRDPVQVPRAPGSELLLDSDDGQWGGFGRECLSDSGAAWVVAGEVAVVVAD